MTGGSRDAESAVGDGVAVGFAGGGVGDVGDGDGVGDVVIGVKEEMLRAETVTQSPPSVMASSSVSWVPSSVDFWR